MKAMKSTGRTEELIEWELRAMRNLAAIMFLVAAICTILFSSNAIAASCTNCTVSYIGVGSSSGIYYVYVDGTWSGPVTCPSPNLAGLTAFTIHQNQNLSKDIYASAVTAFATGKKIDISGNGICHPYEGIDGIIVRNQ